jgi:hypothetical protein
MVGLSIMARAGDEGGSPPLGPLWLLLFGFSILSWVFVLSGLSMETFEGFKAGPTPGATVVGINQAAIDRRPTLGIVETAKQQWALGSIPPDSAGRGDLCPVR